MRAAWKGIEHSAEWKVIRCYRRAPGFGAGALLELGFDNSKPCENKFQCEQRIAKRFEIEPIDLVLEILDQ